MGARSRGASSRIACAAAAALAAVVFVGAATAEMTFAAFSATSPNIGNSFDADTLAAPSGLNLTRACVGTTTVAFRTGAVRTAAASATSTTSLTISVPTETVAGDLLVVQVTWRNGGTINAPSNWTLIRRDVSGTTLTQSLFYRVASSSEPASYAFTNATSGRVSGGMAAYSGVNTSSPIDAHGGQANASATTITAPSITTTTTNTMLVGFFGQATKGTMTTAMTERWDIGTTGGGNAYTISMGADEARGTTGATGTRTATLAATSTADVSIGQLVALRRVAGGLAVSASWTASPSTWADGYKLQRWVGTTQENEQLVTPRTETSAMDNGPLTGGTTYTYRLIAYREQWESPAATATITLAAC